jgi:hypothetical protein
MLCITHVAYDIWYFLYTATDYQFRKANLEACLKTYFESFQPYLEETVTYEEFKTEVYDCKDLIVIPGLFVSNLIIFCFPVNFKGVNFFLMF